MRAPTGFRRAALVAALAGCGESTDARQVDPPVSTGDAATGGASVLPVTPDAPTGTGGELPPVDAAGAPDGAAPPDPDAAPPPGDAAPLELDRALADGAAPPPVPDAALRPDADAPPWNPGTWCGHQWPVQTLSLVGHETELLFAQVWVDAVTPAPGADPRLRAFVGYASPGERPEGGGFTWVEAAHNPACLGCGANNDEYMARLQLPAAGRFDIAWKLERQGGADVYCDRADGERAGSEDGYDPADAARLDVVERGMLTLATLNLRCPRTWDDWEPRRPLLVAALTALDPDAVALQEACADVAGTPDGRDSLGELVTDLIAATGQPWNVVRGNTHVGWGRLDEGIALITPHALVDQRIVALPNPAGSQLFPRKAVLARIAAPGGTFVYAGTHLAFESTPDGIAARGVQLEAARVALEAFRDADEPAFLAGDLNEGAAGAAVQALEAAGYQDAWTVLFPDREGFTYPSDAPRVRIDHVMQRLEPAAWRPAAVQQFADQAAEGVWPSDHRGVWAAFATLPP